MSRIHPAKWLPNRLSRQIHGIVFALLMVLAASPVLAQDATPMPRAGDVPGTAAGCSELLVNGGFEVEELGWQSLLPGLPDALDAEYVSSPVFAGTRAMRLGITAAENTSLTNGIFQIVTLPADASPIALSVQLLPRHETNPGNDLQFIDVSDAITNELIVRLWSQTANRDTWLFQQFDLSSLRGRTVRISIGVSNDGGGGKTALYVDSITLQACDTVPSATVTSIVPTQTPTTLATPTPTIPVIIVTATPTGWTATPIVVTATPIIWTPTPLPPTSTPILPPTPLPAGCITDVILNGSFEDEIVGSTGWILGDDPVPPRLIAGGFVGLRALRLGNPADSGRPDVLSYSSARQLITLPSTAITAELNWTHRSSTQDNGEPTSRNRIDRQELILLSPTLVTMDYPLYRKMINSNGWRVERTDLTAYRGKTFYIYFNVINDGDGLRTWMDLDDVKLTLCYPTPTPLPGMTEISPLASPIIATLTPTAVGAINPDATRSAPAADGVSSGASFARSAEDPLLEQVTQEQESVTRQVGQLVQRFWWMGAIGILLWAFWSFVVRRK